MADNFVAACEHAAEALLSFQNITRDDVQRLAATSTSTTVNNNQPENYDAPNISLLLLNLIYLY